MSKRFKLISIVWVDFLLYKWAVEIWMYLINNRFYQELADNMLNSLPTGVVC